MVEVLVKTFFQGSSQEGVSEMIHGLNHLLEIERNLLATLRGH